MGAISNIQALELRAPRRGEVIALTVDSTARAYDITGLTIAGGTWGEGRRESVVLWMQAETNDVFFHFSPSNNADLDDTAAVAAGGTLAFANTYGAVLEAGNAPVRVCIERSVDKYLVVIAASTSGVLRIWAGSESQ